MDLKETGWKGKARIQQRRAPVNTGSIKSWEGHYWLRGWTVLEQWYSTFFVRVPPDIISLQLDTPKVVGV
jgi:hypothetical protein